MHGTQPSERMRHFTICVFSPGRRRVPCCSRITELPRIDGFAFFREIERHDGNIFRVDVEPDVHFRPIRERENANAFALVMAAVVKIPKFGALVFRVPLAERIAEGIDALFGAGFFLVAARAAESGIETAFGQRVEQRARLQQAAAFLRAQRVGVRAFIERLLILVDDQLRADVLWRTSRETRSSREICSWCRCAGAETEFCPG